jgi:ribosomal protein L24E
MNGHICPHCGKTIYDDDALMCLFCGDGLARGAGTLGRMRYSTSWPVITVAIAAGITALMVLFLM